MAFSDVREPWDNSFRRTWRDRKRLQNGGGKSGTSHSHDPFYGWRKYVNEQQCYRSQREGSRQAGGFWASIQSSQYSASNVETRSGMGLGCISSSFNADTSSLNVACQTKGNSFGPLEAAYRMNTDKLAAEHRHCLSQEKEGLIHNANPDMVASLDMWERKVLRAMGLIDGESVIVAHDADSRPIKMNDDLELINELAFLTVSAIVRDRRNKDGINLQSEQSGKLHSQSLKNGDFGDLVYMCDYCSETRLEESALVSHMEQAGHPTGSTVLAMSGTEPGDNIRPRCLATACSVVRPVPFSRINLVPVCPVCLAAFDRITDCVRHTHSHGGITGVFQLRRVCGQRTLSITRRIRCGICSVVFCSVSLLQRHWRLSGHLRLEREQHQQVVFFRCHCSPDHCRHLSGDFEEMREHVLLQHGRGSWGLEVVGMVKVVYLGGPAPVRRLLPAFPVHRLDVDPTSSLGDCPGDRPPRPALASTTSQRPIDTFFATSLRARNCHRQDASDRFNDSSVQRGCDHDPASRNANSLSKEQEHNFCDQNNNDDYEGNSVGRVDENSDSAIGRSRSRQKRRLSEERRTDESVTQAQEQSEPRTKAPRISRTAVIVKREPQHTRRVVMVRSKNRTNV